jgi:hypothetical protein
MAVLLGLRRLASLEHAGSARGGAAIRYCPACVARAGGRRRGLDLTSRLTGLMLSTASPAPRVREKACRLIALQPTYNAGRGVDKT